MDEVEFQYKPKLIVHLLGGALFLILFTGLLYLALTNTKGAVIGGAIELSKTSATLMYSVFAILFLTEVINNLIILHYYLFYDRKVIISEEYILAPKTPASNKLMKIYYEEIAQVNYTKKNIKNSSLYLSSSNRKLLTIPRKMISSEENFLSLGEIVEKKVKGVPPQKPVD